MPSGNKIFITAENQNFKLNFKDSYVSQNLDKYIISWVVDPNIESSFLILSPNKTVLSVSKGGFQRLTQYSISIYVKHVDIFQAQYSFTFKFTTSTPPFDGSITLSPEFRNYQTYTIVFKDWSTIAGPIAFRVSSTNGQGMKVLDLSTGWVSFKQASNSLRMNNQNFTFSPSDYNSILVELTDYTEEVYSQYLQFKTPPPPAPVPSPPTPTPQPPAPSPPTPTPPQEQTPTSQVNETSPSPPASPPASPVPPSPAPQAVDNTLTPSETTPTPPAPTQPAQDPQNSTTSDPQNSTTSDPSTPNEGNDSVEPSFTNRFSESEPITNFLSRVQDENGDTNSETESMIAKIKAELSTDRKSVQRKLQMLIEITCISEVMTKRAIELSVDIIEMVTSFNDATIRQSIVFILGNLYAANNEDNQRLDNIKSIITSYLCQSDTVSSIKTPKLNLTVTHVDVDHSSHLHLSSKPQQHLDLGAHSYLSLLPLQLSTAMIQNHLQSVCLASSSATLFTTNNLLLEPFSNTQLSIIVTNTRHSHALEQYMQSTVKFAFVITDETTRLNQYDANQTLCMGWENGQWSAEACMTEAPQMNGKGQVEIICSCNTMRADRVAVITDYTRIKSGKTEIIRKRMQTINEEIMKNSLVDSASFKLAIVLSIFGVIIISSLIMVARILDVKDIRNIQCQQIMTETNQELLSKLKELSGQSWNQRQNELQEFSQKPLKSHFSIILSRSYPLISIFGSNQAASTRLDRLSLHLLQVTLYLLLCSLAFLPLHRPLDQVITDTDQTSIIALSLSALLVLIPIQPGKLISPLFPLALSFIALFTSYALTFLAISASRITLICILTSVALGLSIGLSISPVFVAVWNLKVKPTRYYRQLIADVEMVRSLTNGEVKEHLLKKDHEKIEEQTKVQQTDEISGMGQTMNNTFAPLQMPGH